MVDWIQIFSFSMKDEKLRPESFSGVKIFLLCFVATPKVFFPMKNETDTFQGCVWISRGGVKEEKMGEILKNCQFSKKFHFSRKFCDENNLIWHSTRTRTVSMDCLTSFSLRYTQFLIVAIHISSFSYILNEPRGKFCRSWCDHDTV